LRIVWPFATKLIDAATDEALEQLGDFMSPNIASSLAFLLPLSRSVPKVFDAMAREELERLGDFISQTIANSLAFCYQGH